MSFGELLFLAVLALLVFGPRKLPEIARSMARVMTALRRASNEFRYSLEDEIRNLEIQEAAKKRLEAEPARAVPAGTVAQAAAAVPAPEPVREDDATPARTPASEPAPLPAPPAALGSRTE